jgi:hypothetical protein
MRIRCGGKNVSYHGFEMLTVVLLKTCVSRSGSPISLAVGRRIRTNEKSRGRSRSRSNSTTMHQNPLYIRCAFDIQQLFIRKAA